MKYDFLFTPWYLFKIYGCIGPLWTMWLNVFISGLSTYPELETPVWLFYLQTIPKVIWKKRGIYNDISTNITIYYNIAISYSYTRIPGQKCTPFTYRQVTKGAIEQYSTLKFNEGTHLTQNWFVTASDAWPCSPLICSFVDEDDWTSMFCKVVL